MTDDCEVPFFTMYAGDDKLINFMVINQDDEAVDMDGATAAIFAMFEADNGVEKFRLELMDGVTIANSVIAVVIPKESFDNSSIGDYFFELQVTDGNGYVQTLAQGTATVKKAYIT